MLNPIDIRYFKLAVGENNIGKSSDIDIQARCPVCGDSSKKKSSKRLHLYDKNGTTLVNCFNGDCDVHHNLYNFLRNHYPDLLEGYKREVFGNTLKTLSSTFESEVKEIIPDIVLKTFDPSKIAKEITPEVIEFLSKRKLEYTSKEFGTWFFMDRDIILGGKTYMTKNSILIPLYKDSELAYGFYSRKIYEKSFATYMPEENVGYKIWNWFNIDKELPVYIFEGIFDAISSGKKNIIALMGAKLPEERLKELDQPVFVLDNDRTGIYNSISYAERGCRVFVPPEEFKTKDTNELLKFLSKDEISKMITNNIFAGVEASIKLKLKLA